METQTEFLAELEASKISQEILKLIENNPRINLRNLVLLSNYSPPLLIALTNRIRFQTTVEVGSGIPS